MAWCAMNQLIYVTHIDKDYDAADLILIRTFGSKDRLITIYSKIFRYSLDGSPRKTFIKAHKELHVKIVLLFSIEMFDSE